MQDSRALRFPSREAARRRVTWRPPIAPCDTQGRQRPSASTAATPCAIWLTLSAEQGSTFISGRPLRKKHAGARSSTSCPSFNQGGLCGSVSPDVAAALGRSL